MQISEIEYQELKAKLAASEKEVTKLKAAKESLTQQLEWFRKQFFGRKSEKHLPPNPDALMPSLFGDQLTEKEQAQIACEAEKINKQITKAVREKSSKRKKIDTIDTSKLEVREIIIEPEVEINSDEYVRFGEETTDKLIYVKAHVYIERTIRPKYVLKSHLQIKNPEQQTFIVATLPESPIKKSLVSPSLLSHIIQQKYQYHLPFYRVVQQFKDIGFTVSDSTIGDWFRAGCERLRPLYDLLRAEVMGCDYIQVDESTLPVVSDEKRRAVKGYVWVVRGCVEGDVFFHYAGGSRSYATARALLGGFRGAIQTDGYEAYDQFENRAGVVMLGCMAHARRKFTESLSENETLATQGLYFFSKLYALEKQAREEGWGYDKIKEQRSNVAYPLLQTFEKWMEDNYGKVLKSSMMGKAIAYTYSLLPRLSRYVLDGRYQIDNNLCENVIRPLAIGRKNYLFCKSDDSAMRAAIIYSFMGSCKAAGIDAGEWLCDVLTRLPHYEAQGLDVAELLPKRWSKQ